MDSYFTLLNLSFVENFHINKFSTFAKQSMINGLSNPINRNRSAAKISKVMSFSGYLVQCSSEESLGNTNKIHLPNRRSEKETTLI